MSAAAFLLGSKGTSAQTSDSAGYGELVPDPGGLIDLPEGFQYRVISPEGSQLSSGGVVPGDPDNIVVTPWGDLWFAEDGGGENRIVGITPDGQVYKFASNNTSEFCEPSIN